MVNAREKKEGVTEDGIEDAFDLVGEVSLGERNAADDADLFKL